MAAAKEKFLGISTVSTRFKMHFPEDVAIAMAVKEGDRLGFYLSPTGDILVRKM